MKQQQRAMARKVFGSSGDNTLDALIAAAHPSAAPAKWSPTRAWTSAGRFSMLMRANAQPKHMPTKEGSTKELSAGGPSIRSSIRPFDHSLGYR